MKKMVIATHNRDKFAEMKKALITAPWEFIPAFSFPGVPDVVEDGKTLEENSLKKASELSKFTNLPTLADDTGLFVEALFGDPGIFAARYAGEGSTYEENVKKLLRVMNNVREGTRNAIFRTVITIYFPGNNYKSVVGEVKGHITLSPRGENGFGYDPVFCPEGFTKVFSEMSLDEKNDISHRGRAIKAILKYLKD